MDINDVTGVCNCCGEIVSGDTCETCTDCHGKSLRSRYEAHDRPNDGPADNDDWSGGFAENH